MICKLFRLALKKSRLGKRPTKVGQKVMLGRECPYAACKSFPIEGTSYECGGTVLSMRKCRNSAIVKWCNSLSSAFDISHLKVISNTEYTALIHKGFAADNPNITFKKEKNNCKVGCFGSTRW